MVKFVNGDLNRMKRIKEPNTIKNTFKIKSFIYPHLFMVDDLEKLKLPNGKLPTTQFSLFTIYLQRRTILSTTKSDGNESIEDMP